MAPDRGGHANHGHACVKGRFAFGYATHSDRALKPLIRTKITDPWREVSWEEAIDYTAREFRRLQETHGADSIGGITSSRCTNEETFLVQKLVRAAFGTNNVDTCARVCHSPTGYGLKSTIGESAGTQAFDSVMKSDVIIVVGANPTEGHPVFASRLKQRMRQGAKLIVIDPRTIGLVRAPHIAADYHLQLGPGTNVAVINALSHVIVTEGVARDAYIHERCEPDAYQKWKTFIAEPHNSPEATESITGVPAALVRGAAQLFASAPNGAIYYGLGVTEHSQGTTMVMGIANLAMATGNLGREGVGVNPLRGQNNVQGSCDMGSFPHEFSGYRHVSDAAVRGAFESTWGVRLKSEPGLRIPNMFDAALVASLTPTFAGVTYEKLDRLGSIQWPCNEQAPDGTPTMHVGTFVRGKGKFFVTEYVPTTEHTSAEYPLVLTTGRILSQYNVGAQTRRTDNVVWHNEDLLEIHPHDAETRGITHGDWVGITRRAGAPVRPA